MRHRFFLPHVLSPGSTAQLEGAEAHHARVLRVSEGEEIEVFDGRGGAWVAVVGALPEIEIVRPVAVERESPVALHLAMAIIQLDKFELVLQKGTELGVRSFIPLVTERIEVREERYRGKAERWEKIVFEAVKQSGRARVPSIEPAASISELAARGTTKILFDADAEPSPRPHDLRDAILFVGPEGGWSDDELRLARAHDFLFHRLGPRRLRAETAAIAGVALLAAGYGDLA